MRAAVAAAALLVAGSPRGAPRDATPAPVPVLVELFTSEGCSSCPPADAFLARLVAEQPVPGARVIALGEHVDSWDDLGWRDPFSSRAFSARQAAYVARLATTAAYTPQIVVGGRLQHVGSDARAVRAAVAEVARVRTGSIALRVAAHTARAVEIGIEARWASGVDAEVAIAVVQDRAISTVSRGENTGRTLTHVAVARSLAVVATGRGAYAGTAAVEVPHGAEPAHAVVFVQEPGGGPVRAVESITLTAARTDRGS